MQCSVVQYNAVGNERTAEISFVEIEIIITIWKLASSKNYSGEKGLKHTKKRE